MLRNLIIKNYALIRDLNLEFGPGLTIITGETGAGKSIMLGALSLVMGGRADTKMISDGNSRSVVEAGFEDVDPELRSLFDEKGIDWIVNDNGLSEMTIRRELLANGRSKVFVNDTSVTLLTLGQIMPRLIDIHSQHANAKINDPSERLRIIDSMAENEELRKDYRLVFSEYVDLRRRIKLRQENLRRNAENIDFMRFQLEQLDKLAPKRGELAEIERKFEILSDADEIKEKLAMLAALLGDNSPGVQAQLYDASVLASKIDFGIADDEDAEEPLSIAARLSQALVEIKDIYSTVDDYNSRIDTDPATLSRLSARMNLYYEAVKRFKVKDAEELVALLEQLRRKVNAVTLGDDELPEMEREARRLAGELKHRADALTESRVKAAAEFSRLLCITAAPLGLPNIKFEARLSLRKLSSNGQDEVQFLCSFNKNGTLKNLGEIASGGEIARMMLSLKSILAGHINLPTIIFDEVDTGVSGEIADKMGGMMHDVAEKMQVIVITHLPQVAAKGDNHFKVYKTDGETSTETHVLPLTMEQRIRELAAMISGSEVSEAALEAARALLAN